MLINREFNAAAYPYTPPIKHLAQINSIPVEYRKIVLSAWQIDGQSKSVNLDTAKWALGKTNVISLSRSHDENKSWMRMLVNTAMGAKVNNSYPYQSSSICTWGTEKKDGENVKDLIDYISAALEKVDNPKYPVVSVVSNFPYGEMTPQRAANSIKRIGEWLKDYQGEKVVETVANYQAWLDGDVEKVRETLKAERAAATESGLKMKIVVTASAHILAKDNFYKSLYDMTTLVLEEGADIVKTSTDKALKEPHNNTISQDTATPETMLPVLAAVRDFNKKNKANRGIEISGGQNSIVDMARVKFMVEKVAGAKMFSKVTIGGGYMLARNLMQYIAKNDPESGIKRDDFGPQNRKADLPAGLKGLR